MDSRIFDRDISRIKTDKFGSAVVQLGIFYVLMEKVPAEDICAKINAQTDEETIMELKRADILDSWMSKIVAAENAKPDIVYEGVTYARMRDPHKLLEAKIGTHVDILVGVGKIEEIKGIKNATHELIVFVNGNYDVPVFVYFDKKTKLVDIGRDEHAEKRIVPNTSAGICGRKLKNTKIETVDGEKVDAPVITANYVEYTNEYLAMINDRAKRRKEASKT